MKANGVKISALLAAAHCLAAIAGAQISPGPLSEVHAEIDGSRDCLRCHAQSEGVDPAKCLSCHTILGGRIDSGAGLHAQPGYEDCRLCHIDHHGREYELVWWGEEGIESFDHRLTGESLDGAHRDVPCRDCHRAELIQNPGELLQEEKDLDRTFLGLSADCRSCHDDEHEGQFEGSACADCHGESAWVPTIGFDHAASSFALTGKHLDVECSECHRDEPRDADEPMTRFKPVPHQVCSDCHRDPHAGSLGPTCTSCHGTDSWFSTPNFDHDRTRYPLTGRHRRVQCQGCHRVEGGRPRFKDLAFATCTDCHTDPHENRLGADCASCHRTSGWQEVAEDAFDHQTTAFPLEGAHVRVDCRGCHLPDRPLTIAGHETCSTCHEDEHLGQFAQREDGGACQSCHTLEKFVPAIFAESDHATTRFPLAGLHQGVACSECHPATTFLRRGTEEKVEAAKFRYQTLACRECHEDPHVGTADKWLADGGCANCHSDAGWKLSTFDHGTTKFPLEGKHVETPCSECHAPPDATEGAEPAEDQRPLFLTGTTTDCAGCHQDPHAGQFAQRDGGCAGCHNAILWSDLLFDHNRDSSYPLEGAHARAQCPACHLLEAGQPEPFVRYRPLPTECESCHRGTG